VFRYEGAIVRAIGLLKVEEIDPLADWFAVQLVQLARLSGSNDVDPPVPLRKLRRK
jgi:hypothetical protein